MDTSYPTREYWLIYWDAQRRRYFSVTQQGHGNRYEGKRGFRLLGRYLGETQARERLEWYEQQEPEGPKEWS